MAQKQLFCNFVWVNFYIAFTSIIENARDKSNIHRLETLYLRDNPAGNYMFKVNNRNTRTRCEICSKLTIKTPEQ